MKVIAITKVQNSKGEIVDRMQTMIAVLEPGDKTLSDTTVFVRPDDFDANLLITPVQKEQPTPKPSYF